MLLVEGAERFRLVLISQNPTAADSWTKPAPAPPATARFWYSTTTEVHRDTGKNTSDDHSWDAQESGDLRSLIPLPVCRRAVGMFGILGVRRRVHASPQLRAIRKGSVELTVDDDWPRLHAGTHNL
jgi:hypothetical protein